jgi:hypothetical protein
MHTGKFTPMTGESGEESRFPEESRRNFLEKILGITALGVLSRALPSRSAIMNWDKMAGNANHGLKHKDCLWLFSEGFSSTQGADNWYYKEWDGTSYHSMTWNAEDKLWQGRQPLCMIADSWVHPGDNDAVIAWKAPRSGSVCIRGNVRRVVTYGSSQERRVEFRGDGIRFKIMKNSEQVWPSQGWQEIAIEPYVGSYEYPSKEYTYGGCPVKHILVTQVNEGDMIYFHANKRAEPGYDRVEWVPEIIYDEIPWYTTDKMEIVMRPDDLKRLGIHTFDGSFGVLPDGRGACYWWMSEWNGTLHYKLHGPMDDPSKTLVWKKNEKEFWQDFNLPKGHAWLINLYHDTPTGNLLAFIHYEHITPDNFKIGLAVSKDKGETFKLLGFILESEQDIESNVGRGNMFGVPYVIKDGFFYVYYGDYGDSEGTLHVRPAVARAPVSEVLKAADHYTLSPWSKYYNGRWDEPGLGGKASQLFDSRLIVHGDAAYSTFTDTYYLSGYGQGNKERGVFLSRSADGIRWEHTWLVDNSDMDVLCPYITIVNADGTDNAKVGDEFYIYWSFNGEWSLDYNTPRVNYGLQTLYRQKVILSKSRSGK